MATDDDSTNNKTGKIGGGSAPSSSTPSETDSALAKDTSKSLSLQQAEADEAQASSTSLSMESITDGKNDRGIPAAKFIEGIDGFASAFSPRKEHEKECKHQGKKPKSDAGAAKKADSSSAASSAEATACAEIERLKIADCTVEADLFATPPPRDDCPICMLPLPIHPCECTYQTCCGKVVCGGCFLESDRIIREENMKRIANGDPRPLLEDCCPFCREPTPKSMKEYVDRQRKRMDVDDARAFHNIANDYYFRDRNLPKDDRRAFNHFLRAAELGSIDAHYALALQYSKEGTVVKTNLAKSRHYLEQAAKGGHVDARRKLGFLEAEERNNILAIRHFLFVASAGDDDSLEYVSRGYRNGLVSKDEYAAALRAHQKAQDDAKSDERGRFAADLKRKLH